MARQRRNDGAYLDADSGGSVSSQENMRSSKKRSGRSNPYQNVADILQETEARMSRKAGQGDRNRFSDGKQAEQLEDLYNVLTDKVDKSIPRGFSDEDLIKKVEGELEKAKTSYMQDSQELY